MKNKWIVITLGTLVGLEIVSLLIGAFSSLNQLESFRIVFGSTYVLFLPGFILTFVFFPKLKKSENPEKGAIDWIERIALSFALSIAVVPLAVFYLNLIGLKINALNSFFTILGIILIGLLLVIYRRKRLRRF